jgi:hypothetical protein
LIWVIPAKGKRLAKAPGLVLGAFAFNAITPNHRFNGVFVSADPEQTFQKFHTFIEGKVLMQGTILRINTFKAYAGFDLPRALSRTGFYKQSK